jgi:PBP1b-binding outer membrane lipoprotein LpoB
MKKIALLLIALLMLNACSPNDDLPKYHYEILPIVSYTVPQSFDLGATYPIKVKYKKGTICNQFQGFYYEKNINIRTVAIQTMVMEGSNCTIDTTSAEVSFNFNVTSNGSYIFKFYKGQDAAGNDLFHEVEIPVN